MIKNISNNSQLNNIMLKANKAAEIISKNGASTIVLFESERYFETFNDNAEQIHKFCKFQIIHYGKIAHLDFKKECSNWVFPKMIREGYKICIMQKGTY